MIDYSSKLYKKSTNFNGIKVEGYTTNKLLDKLRSTGFQATNLAKSIDIFKKNKIPFVIGFTSNCITSGLRETIAHFIKIYKPIAVVTTAGSIEEDFLKCNTDFKIIDTFKDLLLRDFGQNRSGNIIAPSQGYINLELHLQNLKYKNLNSRKIINYLTLKNKNSFLYICKKNKIPIFCPAILDGAIGDFFYFHRHQFKNIDVLQDHIDFNKLILSQEKLGAIILGGSIPKHYIYNANICRDGLDYAIHFTTDLDYDGSNAGANPSEAISWGKINNIENSVKIIGDFTINFSLFVNLLNTN